MASDQVVQPNEDECRICLESTTPLLSPCRCSGSLKYAHKECLLEWINTSGSTKCNVCKSRYNCKLVFRGICWRSLIQNDLKHLIVFIVLLIYCCCIVAGTLFRYNQVINKLYGSCDTGRMDRVYDQMDRTKDMTDWSFKCAYVKTIHILLVLLIVFQFISLLVLLALAVKYGWKRFVVKCIRYDIDG